MFIRVAWGLMVAGVLLLITASVMASRHRTSMDGTAIVPATVIDRQMVLTNGINRNRPVVSFITGAGKNVAFISMSTLRLEDDLGAAIVDLAANVPYGVQRLGHETWDDLKADGRKTVMLADVRTRHRLPGSSTVQAALAALVRPDIVMKGRQPLPRERFVVSGVGGTANVRMTYHQGSSIRLEDVDGRTAPSVLDQRFNPGSG